MTLQSRAAKGIPPTATALDTEPVASGNSRTCGVCDPFVLLLWVVIGLSLLLRTQGIGTVSYWFDESSSWKTIQFGWGDMWTRIARNVHPPVFYVALKAWAIPFGDGPVSLRMFSAVCGVLTVLAAYSFVLEALRTDARVEVDSHERRRHATALFAASLIGMSTIHVVLSLQARMYTLGTLLALLCGTAMVRIVRTGGTWPQWVVFTACGTGISLTHYYGLFTLAAAYVFLASVIVGELMRRPRSGLAGRLSLAAGLSGWVTISVWAFWLPSFLSQRAQVSVDYWIADFKWWILPWTCFEVLSMRGAVAMPSDWLWLAVGFWLLVCLLAACMGGRAGRFAAAAALIPPLAAIGYSMHARSIFYERYLVFAQSFVLAGWALVVHHVGWRPARAALMVASLGWCSYWTWQHVDQRQIQGDRAGLRNASNTLNDWMSADDRVIVASPMLHPTIQRYLHWPGNVNVLDQGFLYPHYRAGPILRVEEYFPLQLLTTGRLDRVFTVDVLDRFGKGTQLEVGFPKDWRCIRSDVFEERYGQACSIVIREYRRVGDAEPQAETLVDDPRLGPL